MRTYPLRIRFHWTRMKFFNTYPHPLLFLWMYLKDFAAISTLPRKFPGLTINFSKRIMGNSHFWSRSYPSKNTKYPEMQSNTTLGWKNSAEKYIWSRHPCRHTRDLQLVPDRHAGHAGSCGHFIVAHRLPQPWRTCITSYRFGRLWHHSSDCCRSDDGRNTNFDCTEE